MRTLPSLAVLLELTVLHHTAYNQVHADKTFRWHGVAQGSNEAASSAKEVGIGSKDCPLDVEVLWTAEVESPVYSTPLIYPFTPNGHKQVVFATLRHALEMLEADGSVPWQWPVEFDGTVFHASPVVYDIDEDGLQDLCVASTDGNVHWISLGEYPRYMETYHLKLPPRRLPSVWLTLIKNKQNQERVSTPPQAHAQEQHEHVQAQPAERAESTDMGMLNDTNRKINSLPDHGIKGNGYQRDQHDQGVVGSPGIVESSQGTNINEGGILPKQEGKGTSVSSRDSIRESTGEQHSSTSPNPNPGPKNEDEGGERASTVENRVQGILDPDSNTSPNLSSEQEGGVAAPRKRMLLGLGLGLELEGNEDNEEVEEEEKGEKEGEEKEGLSRGIWDAVGNDSPQHGTHGTTHGTHRNGSPDPYVSASVSGFDADVNNYGDNYGDNFGDMYGSGYYPYPFPGGDDLMMAGYWEEYGWGAEEGLADKDEEADISVDAHILAAPVFADVNGDQVAEMIIPVSYFYDTHRYARKREGMSSKISVASKPPKPDGFFFLEDGLKGGLGKFEIDELEVFDSIVLAGLSCWDYKHQQWLWTANLGEIKLVQDNQGQENQEDQRNPSDRSRQRAQGVGGVDGVVQGVNIYASPTVADLEGDGKLEVIIGTSLGEVHILDAHTGHPRRVIRQKYGEIQSQVAVADVYGDDQLEMFVGDMDGNLACLSAQGEELWRRKLSGAISNTPMLGDIDGDGSLDVVVGVGVTILDREGQDEQQGQEGHVHAVSGGFGLDLPFFPVRLHNKGGLSAPALLVNLHEWTAGLGGALDYTNLPSRAFGRGLSPWATRFEGQALGGKGSGLHLVLPSRDGHIFVIEGSTGCVNKIDVGEQVLAMVVADDLLGDGTLDLVVGTITGEVVALDTNVPFHPLNSWTGPVRGGMNGFVHGTSQGIFFRDHSSTYARIATREFPVSFEIVDRRSNLDDRNDLKDLKDLNDMGDEERWYQVTMTAGVTSVKTILLNKTYSAPGVYTELISFPQPMQGMLRMHMVNKHHQYFEDSVSISYNTEFYAPLKWVLAIPLTLAAAPLLWMKRASSFGPLPP